MADSYNRKTWARSLQQAVLIGVLAGATAGTAQAQALNYAPSTASNVAGTFTDLATVTTSVVIPTANTDDANSAAQPIGFTFKFNNTAFTQFILNTNGLIRLGSTAPSTAALYYENFTGGVGIDPLSAAAAAETNLLMPFNIDLQQGTGTAEYRVSTTGTSPNQVCTIQWKNVSDKSEPGTGAGSQYANLSFQTKLYENGNIEFVYNAAVASANVAATRFPNVGLKGSGIGTGQVTLALKAAPAAAWSTTTFIGQNYGTAAHNVDNTRLPDAGRTYRFAPAPSRDAAVSAIYTLGKIASPAALPHAVRAVVTNAGSGALTNIDVTLNVTGANTFSDVKRIASLAAGTSATVTFASYPATLALGTDTVTVTVPADGNNANNSAQYRQLVSADRVSYIDPSAPAPGNLGNGNAIFGSNFTLNTAVALKDVVLNFAPGTVAAPNTAPYQVVVYDASGAGGLPGKLLYTSATQNRTTAGGAITLTLPNVAVPTSFFVGVKETSSARIGIAFQTESPIRTNTFFFSTDGLAWNDFAPNNSFRIGIEIGVAVPNCAPPTALAMSTTTATGATVSFTAAAGTASYEILYGPTGFSPGSGGTLVTATASPVTLTGLNPATTYQVYVRSICTAGGNSSYSTPVTFVTQCAASQTVSAFPYTQNFDSLVPGQPLPCGFSVLDANADGTTWAVTATNSNSGVNSIRYRGLTLNNVAANDWFFTPALNLLATSRYQVAFRYRGEGITNSPSSYTESLEVKSGTAATVAGQTTLLYTNAAITNTSYALANGTSVPVVALLPAGASTQYVGFHVNSKGNQGNLYIDDVAITAVAVTATSEALLRAVSVFPNPSATGIFDLEVHGANAKGGLDVQVTNLLGQRVYSGAARDNYTNRLDLSSLAPGIYTLQVRNGDERLTRQVSIVR
jgi:trimeric autotransporter adhesin